jgi:hypothetical protein
MKKNEKDVFLSLSKGHQTWNLPLGTKQDASPLTSKHWILSIGHQAKCFPIDLQTLDSFQGLASLEPSINHQVMVFPHLFASSSL